MNKILNILKSKDEFNEHYLNRYVKFIELCREKNKNLTESTPIERHHICPAGKTFFPEYKSFKLNPWNLIKLTPRQHFIAHWILAKALGKGMWLAFLRMCGKNAKTNSREYKISSRVYEIARKNYAIHGITKEQIEKSAKAKIGRTNFKNDRGEIFFLNVDDPRIIEENLVGVSKGYKFTDSKNEGYVTCIDIETNEYIRVSKDVFESNKGRYKGVNYRKESSTLNKVPLKSPDGKFIYVDKFKVDDYLSIGYIKQAPNKGKPLDSLKGKVWVNNTKENLRILESELEYYLNVGYTKGRLKFKQSKVREIITCNVCGKSGKLSGRMKLFHFENCKSI